VYTPTLEDLFLICEKAPALPCNSGEYSLDVAVARLLEQLAGL